MEYLPLGTVVLLKNGNKEIMIYGRKQYDINRKVIWDYIACLYPEGNINENYQFLFNNEDIDKVIFKGFSDEKEIKYCEELNNLKDEEILKLHKDNK